MWTCVDGLIQMTYTVGPILAQYNAIAGWYRPYACCLEILMLHLEICKLYRTLWSVIFDKYIHGLVQDCSISSVLALEILQSCTKPSIYSTSLEISIWFNFFLWFTFCCVFSCGLAPVSFTHFLPLAELKWNNPKASKTTSFAFKLSIICSKNCNTGINIKHWVYMPVRLHMVWKIYLPCKNFYMPSQYSFVQAL